MKSFILDLDGTLCDIRHRLHWVTSKPRNFDAFELACVSDQPHYPVLDVASALVKADHHCLIFSGRSKLVEQQTLEWLAIHLPFIPSMVQMRERGDCRPDYVVKGEMLDRAIEAGYNPSLAIDDRNQVCDLWVRRKIFVFNVNQTRAEF